MDSAFAAPLHSLLVAAVQAVPPEAWIWLGLLIAGLLPAFLRPRRGGRTTRAHPAPRRADAGPEATVSPPAADRAPRTRHEHLQARAIVETHLAARREGLMPPNRARSRIERCRGRRVHAAARGTRRG